jgi:hypothetical protein
MTHDAELTVTPPTEPARSAAAERMRRHRERSRQGLRCVTILLRNSEVDELVKRQLLAREHQNNGYEITKALHTLLDDTLGHSR